MSSAIEVHTIERNHITIWIHNYNNFTSLDNFSKHQITGNTNYNPYIMFPGKGPASNALYLKKYLCKFRLFLVTFKSFHYQNGRRPTSTQVLIIQGQIYSWILYIQLFLKKNTVKTHFIYGLTFIINKYFIFKFHRQINNIIYIKMVSFF